MKLYINWPQSHKFHKKELIYSLGVIQVCPGCSFCCKRQGHKQVHIRLISTFAHLTPIARWSISFLASLIKSDIDILYLILEMFFYRLLVWLAPVYASGIVRRQEMYFPHVRTYLQRASVCGV